MECKYCHITITGQRRKFCCHNHKTMFYKQEKYSLLKTLKSTIPAMFEDGYEWNENDNKMLTLYFEHKDIIKNLIDILVLEKNNTDI